MPLLDTLLSVVAPHSCLGCQIEGGLLCRWCAPDAFPALPSRCYRCHKSTQDSATCKQCRSQSKLKHVWVVTDYDFIAKQLLHKYKFERAQAAAAIIAAAMSDRLPYVADKVLIVPVPTATVRIRQRGYDHAALLAQSLARSQNRQWSRAVTRLTQSRQVGASRRQRMHQLQGAFEVTQPQLVRGADILIVDDVITTGATLEAVSTMLKQAGAKTITAVIFAQKQ